MAADHPMQTITLRDGRALAYAEYGDAKGTPAFYFHGTPGSRLEGEHLHAAAVVGRVRIIGVDRPGFGGSTFLAGRQFHDWPDDLIQLADALGIGRFGVIGLSGGGPHVAACAARIADRLIAACVLSGAAPKEARIETARSWWRRLLYRWNYFTFPLFARGFAAQMAFFAKRTPASRFPKFIDKRVMSRPRAREQFKRSTVEAFRNGSRGAAHEFTLHSRSWRTDPATVAMPVHMWHGDADTIVPFETARWLAERYPDARATWLPGEGHLLFVDHAGEVISVVADAARTAVGATSR
jgi:pimeloyl-ACP methyl ester carboxylesterase